MPVLLNKYKKIQYLIDSLVLPFIKDNHPKWRELIFTYLEYLDNNSLFKAMNITDNVDVNKMYEELLDDFLELYFKDVIDLDKFGLNDDNKRLFIALSKLIGNLKSTKTSFGFFFNSFTDFSIPSDSGDISVNDLTIELKETPEWWLINNDPTRPYTYVFKIDTPELSNLKELIKQVHPAGWLQLFLFEVEFEEFMNGYDCFELDISWGVHYNGKYNYDGTMTIEGTQYTMYYDGGYTFSDDINCAEAPRYFTSVTSIVHSITSNISVPRYFTSVTSIVHSITSDIEKGAVAPAFILKKDLSNESPAQFDIRALTFDSTNDKIIAGTRGYAQLWVSGDGGETWVFKKEIRSETFQTHVNALTFDSTNDKIIAGTRDDAQIWVSGDGGETWVLKKDLSNEVPDQIYVNALTFDSTNDKIIAGTANDAQLWVSGDGGETWVLKKDLSNEVPDESYVSALTFDSTNDKIIAGTRFNGQLWVSGDGGDTWVLKKDLSNEVPSHGSIDSLTFDSANDKIIASSSFGIGGYAQLWVSGDGGETWVLKKDFENVTPKQDYVYSLTFDSENNRIIAGTNPDAQIWESTDGGDNWTLIKDLSDETPSQTFVYSLTFDSTNKRVIAGTAGDAQLWVEL